MNKSFAVLGSPISHSKSPIIHLAAYRVLGEDWGYSRHEVAKGGLKRYLEIDGAELTGLSLTMPLKEEAFALATVTDDVSKSTRASNTLVRVENEWHAFNTDVFGITQSVREALAQPMNPANNLTDSAPISVSLIIGSGATATSAMAALALLAPGSKVLVSARNRETSNKLVTFGTELGLNVSATKRLAQASRKAQLTISTLPGGAMDLPAKKLAASRFFKPGGLLLDVAYHPWPSELAEAWLAKNQRVVSGLDMLIWQAVAQIRIFRSGSPTVELPNEIAVLQAMRIALEQ
jgi:shikimate dehydrogenase